MRDFAGLVWQRVSNTWESKRDSLYLSARACVWFLPLFLENINLSLNKAPRSI